MLVRRPNASRARGAVFTACSTKRWPASPTCWSRWSAAPTSRPTPCGRAAPWRPGRHRQQGRGRQALGLASRLRCPRRRRAALLGRRRRRRADPRNARRRLRRLGRRGRGRDERHLQLSARAGSARAGASTMRSPRRRSSASPKPTRPPTSTAMTRPTNFRSWSARRSACRAVPPSVIAKHSLRDLVAAGGRRGAGARRSAEAGRPMPAACRRRASRPRSQHRLPARLASACRRAERGKSLPRHRSRRARCIAVYGKGAGSWPTATAVFADVMDAAARAARRDLPRSRAAAEAAGVSRDASTWLRASAPASIGNVGVGFDILGQAFDAARDGSPPSARTSPASGSATVSGLVDSLPDIARDEYCARRRRGRARRGRRGRSACAFRSTRACRWRPAWAARRPRPWPARPPPMRCCREPFHARGPAALRARRRARRLRSAAIGTMSWPACSAASFSPRSEQPALRPPPAGAGRRGLDPAPSRRSGSRRAWRASTASPRSADEARGRA